MEKIVHVHYFTIVFIHMKQLNGLKNNNYVNRLVMDWKSSKSYKNYPLFIMVSTSYSNKSRMNRSIQFDKESSDNVVDHCQLNDDK